MRVKSRSNNIAMFLGSQLCKRGVIIFCAESV
jgi:hypothetical protein